MTFQSLAKRPTAVYRCYDKSGRLLYVGISFNPNSRLGNHRVNKPWWPEVGKVTTEWCRNRTAARCSEAQAIADENPLFNIQQPSPNNVRESKTWPKYVYEAPQMSYEHAAGILRMSTDLLERLVNSGWMPHSCRKGRVWFTPANLRDFRMIYARRFHREINDRICLDGQTPKACRRAMRAMRLRVCPHTA